MTQNLQKNVFQPLNKSHDLCLTVVLRLRGAGPVIQQQMRRLRRARVDRGVQHREPRGAAQLGVSAAAQQQPLERSGAAVEPNRWALTKGGFFNQQLRPKNDKSYIPHVLVEHVKMLKVKITRFWHTKNDSEVTQQRLKEMENSQ